jgi:Rho termination factor, N-terminal domain
MPPAGRGRKDASLKDPELYETLRDDGASKQKAARISNAAAKKGRAAVAHTGGKSPAYDDWTVADLRSRAREIGLTGFSKMKKADLISALRKS